MSDNVTNEHEERLIALLPDCEEPVVVLALLVLERVARDEESKDPGNAALARGLRDVRDALAFLCAHWRSGPLGGCDPSETLERLAALHRETKQH